MNVSQAGSWICRSLVVLHVVGTAPYGIGASPPRDAVSLPKVTLPCRRADATVRLDLGKARKILEEDLESLLAEGAAKHLENGRFPNPLVQITKKPTGSLAQVYGISESVGRDPTRAIRCSRLSPKS